MNLTLNDLIAKRMEKEKRATLEIFVKSLGGSLTFEKPSKESMLELIEIQLVGGNSSEFYKVFQKIVYDCCPVLKSSELHEEYGIKDPYDIVDALFEVTEVIELATQLSEFDGTSIEQVDEALKNS